MTDFSVINGELDADVRHFDEIYPSLNNSRLRQYYDHSTFNSAFPNDSVADLSIFHVNTQSINAKGDNLISYLSILSRHFDIICLTETWYGDEKIAEIFFEQYIGFYSNRVSRSGGGSCILVSKKLNCQITESLNVNTDFVEAIFVDLLCNNKKVTIGSIYRPPNTNFENFISFIEMNLQPMTSCGSDIFVCGDFNLDMLKINGAGSKSSIFYNTMSSLSLLPVISKPTRVTDETSTLIDNIFTNNFENFTSGIMKCDISDHYPIFVIYSDYYNEITRQPKEYSYRVINDETLDKLYHKVASANFSDVLSEGDVDSAVISFHNKLLNFYNECCPIKTKSISVKDQLKPWINPQIKTLIKRRENMFKLFKRNLMTRTEYNFIRNQVTSAIRKSKQIYYQNLFTNIKNDIKKTWQTINKIMSFKCSSKKDIKELIFNDQSYNDNYEMANLLNESLTKLPISIQNSIPRSSVSTHYSQYLTLVSPVNSFFFSPVSPSDVENIIVGLKSKSSHINTYSVKTLKHLKNLISPVLSELINKSFMTSTFPGLFKQARVTPIFKSGCQKDPNNYRPISVLPVLSKIFEKVACRQLYSYFEYFSLFTKAQFGFREGVSTSHAIINKLQFVYDNLDNGDLVLSIFLDFRKAFDCVDHMILISKLSKYGIRGIALDWFKSYLSDRYQCVAINNSLSEPKPVSCGVPQGSILGPLLFLIFINDFPNSSQHFHFTLFADDSTLSCRIPDSSTDIIKNTIERELQSVSNWVNSNKLVINAKKSNFMIFSYRKKFDLPPLKFGCEVITKTDDIKFLGLYIDKHLNFNRHLRMTCSKISKSIGVLYKLSSFLPAQIMKTLYYTLIYPYLRYSVESWYGASIGVSDAIQVQQKKAIRAVFQLPFNHTTRDCFREHSIMKIDDIYKLNLSSILFDYNKKLKTDYISPKVNPIMESHDYNTRHGANLQIIRFNRTQSQNSFLYQSVKVWNSLPHEIKSVPTNLQFKKKLKTWYLSRYSVH